MTTRLPCHFLPGLHAVDPVCGELALLTTSCTLNPVLVTCPRCQHILMQHDRPGKAPERLVGTRRLSTPSFEGGRASTATGSGKNGVSEQMLLREVRRLAQQAGYLCYHTWRSEHSEPGFPDVILAKPGRALLAVELKTAKGKLTRAQDMWLQCLRQVTGVQAHIWRPGDLDDIRDLLI